MAPDLTDVFTKLKDVDDKLDRVRNHVNVLATLTKERERESLFKLCKGKLGSADMMKLWYHADRPTSIRDLCKKAGIDEKKGGEYLRRLHERGLLYKNELGDPVTYVRDEISEGIGLDKWVEGELKKEQLPAISASAQGKNGNGES